MSEIARNSYDTRKVSDIVNKDTGVYIRAPCEVYCNWENVYMSSKNKGEFVNTYHQLYTKTVKFLLSIPTGVHSEQERLSLAYASGLDIELISQINFAGPAIHFFQLLINTLVSYGQLSDARDAVIALLKSVKGLVGIDKQRKLDNLIEEWQEYLQKESKIMSFNEKVGLLTPEMPPNVTRKIAKDIALNYDSIVVTETVDILIDAFNKVIDPTTQFWIVNAMRKLDARKAMNVLYKLKSSSSTQQKHPLVIHGINEAIKHVTERNYDEDKS